MAAKILHYGAFAAVLLAIDGSAAAQPPPILTDADRQDIGCILAMGAVAEQVAKQQQLPLQVVQATATYFFGKIKGRHPNIKFKEALTPAVVEGLQGKDLQATLRRCGGELKEAGTDIRASGDAMGAKEKD